MQTNISDVVTAKLTDIEKAADALSVDSNVQNIGNLKRSIKEFFDFMPELAEKCEASQAINVIDLFYLFCTKYHFDSLLNTNISYQLRILYFKGYLLQAHWLLDQLSECLLEMVTRICELSRNTRMPSISSSRLGRLHTSLSCPRTATS